MTTVTGKRVILKNLQDEYLIPFTDQGGSGNPDNETIILNDEDALRAIKVMDQGQEEPYAFREVTAQEYAAMKQAGTLDPHTYYNVPDVDDIVVDVNSKANRSLDNLNEAGQAIINSKANTSLSNLTAAGEKHFLNKTQITNCILESPNGIATYSGSTITVKEGLKVLIPNGRNADGSLNNIEVTLDADVTETNTYTYDYYSTYLAYENNQFSCLTTSTLYYDEETNYYKNSNTQEIRYVVKIAQATARNNGTVTSFNPLQSDNLLKRSDKAEISGWGMPSGRYVDLTLGASGTTYTAPANGYYVLSLHSTGNSYSYLNNSISGTLVGGFISATITEQRIMPVKRGDVVTIAYGPIDGQDKLFKFIYSTGSETD